MKIELSFKEADYLMRALESYQEEIACSPSVSWDTEKDIQKLWQKLLTAMRDYE